MNGPGNGTTRFRKLRISLIRANVKTGGRGTQSHGELIHIPKFAVLAQGFANRIAEAYHLHRKRVVQ